MTQSWMERQIQSAHWFAGNMDYIEGLYESYLMDPNSVDDYWRNEFDTLSNNSAGLAQKPGSQDVPHSPVKAHFLWLAKNRHSVSVVAEESVSP